MRLNCVRLCVCSRRERERALDVRVVKVKKNIVFMIDDDWTVVIVKTLSQSEIIVERTVYKKV